MDVSVSGTIDQKTNLKKVRGSFIPLCPPGSAYEATTKSDWSVTTVGSEVVGYCRGPYWLRVNLVVAGAQVGLPTKQPDVLKLPSQSKANKRLSPFCSLITLQ